MSKQKTRFDPAATLREIAADPESPATARVAACKALLALDRDPEAKDAAPSDAVATRALRLLKGGRP